MEKHQDKAEETFTITREVIFQDNADFLVSKDTEEATLRLELQQEVAIDAIDQALILLPQLKHCNCSNNED